MIAKKLRQRTRWVCPNGCPAKLGSTRPRKDDVVRYCLACSERSGKLVPRCVPAEFGVAAVKKFVEKIRAEREEKTE